MCAKKNELNISRIEIYYKRITIKDTFIFKFLILVKFDFYQLVAILKISRS